MIWILLSVVILQLALLVILLNRTSNNSDLIKELAKELARKEKDVSDLKKYIDSKSASSIGNRAILRNIESRLSVIECTLNDCELEFEHYTPEEKKEA